MKKAIVACILLNMALLATSAFAQVKMSREQMLFYTSDWKGDRFPDGRPKLAGLTVNARSRYDHRGCLGVLAQQGIQQSV